MKIRSLIGITALACCINSCTDVAGLTSASRSTSAEVPAPRFSTEKVPLGYPHPAGKAHMVVSPYRPYNVIDVKGFYSGNIVGDPSTGKIDPASGMVIPGTAKRFRIP